MMILPCFRRWGRRVSVRGTHAGRAEGGLSSRRWGQAQGLDDPARAQEASNLQIRLFEQKFLDFTNNFIILKPYINLLPLSKDFDVKDNLLIDLLDYFFKYEN